MNYKGKEMIVPIFFGKQSFIWIHSFTKGILSHFVVDKKFSHI